MSRVFTARYYSRCPACDEQIEPGDEVAYDDGEVVHDTCHSDDLYGDDD